MSEVTTFSLGLAAPALLGLAAAAALATAVGATVDWLVKVGSTPIDQVDSEFMRAYRAARRRRQNELTRSQLDRQLIGPVAAAQAALDALQAQPALVEVARRFRPAALEEAHRLLAEALTAADSQLSAEAAARVGALVAETRGILAELHCRASLLAVSEALNGLGYRVRAAVGSGEAVLWATRGSQAVAVVAGKAGELSMDLVGFDGLACQVESGRVLAELGRLGFRVGRRRSVLHGRRSGGALAARVSRLVGESGGEPAEVLLGGLPAVRTGQAQPDNLRAGRLLLPIVRTPIRGR